MTTYSAVVLEHFRRPRNQRRLAAPAIAREEYNPLCGDRVRVEVDVSGDIIHAAAFTANACAICTASASLLTERLTGLPLHDAAHMDENEVIAALETEVPGPRRACATLPLRAVTRGIAEYRAGNRG